MRTIIKDPDAVLDYYVDWSNWLELVADTIATSEWGIDPAGLTIDSSTNTDTRATIWLSGGTVGESYVVTNHITTAGGREDDRSFRITVKER